MLPRSVNFQSLFLGVLLFPLPLAVVAQSSEDLAPGAKNIPSSVTETTVSRFRIDTSSNFPDEFRFATPPHFLLSTDSAVEPWQNADEHQDTEGAAQSTPEAHLDLLPLFAKWHEDVAEHQGGNQPVNLENEQSSERYHWKGLLWQSFGFFGVENAYRLFTDTYLRHLIATGPFWTNYGISLQHWDMNRWNDGDDFVVAYVGHPMQGSVTEFIEIQNDPHDRFLQISSDPAYWRSRFKGFLWATVFSTDQKVGPLGEAALGDQGGYTYPLGCVYPCSNYKPGVTEYTNDTGWVKFITTPVVGTLWTLAEDTLDRYVSGPIQENHADRVFPKILRGSLNPARTMANALRGKNPWYRDFQHPGATGSGGVHFERSDEDFIRHLPRYEIFPHFNALSLPVNTTTCTQCRMWTNGSGTAFSVRMSRWWGFDSDVDYQPNASPLPSYKAGGDVIVGTFGLRAGIISPHYALNVSLRPGFVSYNRAYEAIPSKTDPVPPVGRITHFATALTVGGDYGITRNVAIRATYGNTPVRYLDYYLEPPGIGKIPYLNWLSHEFFETNENWTYQAGPVLKF